jgi:hypothetical protein
MSEIIRPTVPEFYRAIPNPQRLLKSLVEEVNSSLTKPGDNSETAEGLPQVKIAMTAEDFRNHHVFPRIVEMGKAGVPYILEEYKKTNHIWFSEPLEEILNEDPARDLESQTYTNKRDAWISLGERRGYLPVPNAKETTIFDLTKITPFPASKAV